MDLLLIGGVSGSGKSVALAALEDSGYYAVSTCRRRSSRPADAFEARRSRSASRSCST